LVIVKIIAKWKNKAKESKESIVGPPSQTQLQK